MPEQLKIIIDADVQRAITGVQNLSKVITTDFTIATNAAAAAAVRLSSEVNASVQRINASLSSLKITSLDVSVNTSSIDASIKNIQSKFAALIDPQINVLANTAQAEMKIKELLADLTTLKGSQIFITANDTQALQKINEIETELNSLVGKQIQLNVNTGDAIQKINLLEKELIDLQNLSIAPNISSTQLGVFQANIQRIKTEIASLKGQGVVIPIEANTSLAQKNINLLSETIETLRARIEARKSFISVETDITKIAQYNKEIQSLESRMRSIQNVGKKGFELFVVPGQTIQSVKNLTNSVAAFGGGVRTFIPPAISSFRQLPAAIHPVIGQLKSLEAQSKASGAAVTSSFSKAFGGLRSLAALIPGIGLGGLIGLAATAVNSLTNGFFEAAFGASKLDKAIDAASESIDKNAASVVVMVRALQSGTLSSSEFKEVKAELIAQAPEFQKTFEGDKISIEASDLALQKYIKQLTNTIRVTAALGIVNDALAESLRTIAKGGDLTGGQKIKSFFLDAFSPITGIAEKAKDETNSLNKALDSFKPENINKLIDDTFKKLGISFKDFAGTVDPNALKDKLAKLKAEFEKFQNETLAKAQAFKKQFGDAFVLPDLEVSFFVDKNEVFKRALKVLSNVKKDLASRSTIDNLELKLPVLFTTETKFNQDDLKKFIRNELKFEDVRKTIIKIPIILETDVLPIAPEFKISQETIDGFFQGIKFEANIPVNVIPDFSLSAGNLAAIDKKLDLRKQFSILGDLGLKEFNKIDFSNMNAGIAEATKRLEGMMAIATTLNQAIGQGLSGAFNSVFDAVLEGKSVFKALGNAVKQLVVETIKAVVQMLILKAVTKIFFPGGGLPPIPIPGGGRGNSANFGQLSGIGSRAFNNVLTVNVIGNISGDTILLAGQRAANSQGRSG